MKRLLSAAAALLCAVGLAVPVLAQTGSTNVTASSISIGNAPVTGTVSIAAVSQIGQPLSIVSGGTGTQTLYAPTAFTAVVTAGALPAGFQVPDQLLATATTANTPVFYSVTVYNTVTKSSFSFQVPPTQAITGSTWALDHYTPAQTAVVSTTGIVTGASAPAHCGGASIYYQNVSPYAESVCVGGVYVVRSGGSGSAPATASTPGTVQLAAGQTSTTLAVAATTGSYTDLLNKPTIPASATAASIAGAIQAQTGCTTAGYVWLPQSNTCVAQTAGGGTNTITSVNGVSTGAVTVDAAGAAAAVQTNLTTETTRAQAAESTNATAVTTEATNRTSAVSGEATTRASADTANSTAITGEATTARAAEGANATAINTEVVNRVTAFGANLRNPLQITADAAISLNTSYFTGSSGFTGQRYHCAGPAYCSQGVYFEDETYSALFNPELFSAAELANVANAGLANTATGGQIYPAVNQAASGAGLSYSGFDAQHAYVSGVAMYMIPLLDYLHYRKTNTTTQYAAHVSAIKTAWAYSPVNGTTGCPSVTIGASEWVAASLFLEQPRFTGDVASACVLRDAAAIAYSKLATAAGDTTNATFFNAIVTLTTASIQSEFVDTTTSQMLFGATGQDKQIDVLTSSMAVWFSQFFNTNILTAAQQASIGTFLHTHLTAMTYNGYFANTVNSSGTPISWATIGQIPSGGGGSGYTAFCTGGSTGNYQNGYWSLATGMAAAALQLTNPTDVSTLLATFRDASSGGSNDPAWEYYTLALDHNSGTCGNATTPNMESPQSAAWAASHLALPTPVATGSSYANKYGAPVSFTYGTPTVSANGTASAASLASGWPLSDHLFTLVVTPTANIAAPVNFAIVTFGKKWTLADGVTGEYMNCSATAALPPAAGFAINVVPINQNGTTLSFANQATLVAGTTYAWSVRCDGDTEH